MSQIGNLSAECREIVENYIFRTNIFLSPKKKLELMSSLYAMVDGADPVVLSILHDSIRDLNETLSKKDISILCNEYPAVMQYCFERGDLINESVYRVDANGYTNKMLPGSLLELCLRLASPGHGDNVFLPYAGYTQIALRIPDAYYCGFEQNEKRWALSQMMHHVCRIHSSITLTDDMHKSIPEGNKFDYIFCMPPFANGDGKKSVVSNISELATKYLADNGCMCCILPKIFCFAKSGWSDVRKILRDYNNQYSAIIITLPRLNKLFNFTSLCIFCLYKDGKGDVLLMDASKNDAFMVMHDPDFHEDWDINADSIIAILKHGTRDYCWCGKVKDLSDDVDLSPSHYILPEAKKSKKVEKYDLGDLVEIVPTEHIEKRETTCPYIGIKELSDNYLNCEIPYNTIHREIDNDGILLTEDCLLIGLLGDTIRVGKTVGLSFDRFIALSRYIIPIRLKTKKVSEEFLLKSFMSNDDLIEEERMLSVGSSFKEDFLKMQIAVPSFEEQNRLLITDSKSSISEAELKLKNAYEEFRREIHMKKHAIGQTIFNISNWWNLLKLAREKGSGHIDDNAELGTTRKVKVADIFSNLEMAMSKLSTQFSKLDTGYGLHTEFFSLTSFIEKYITEHSMPLFEYIFEPRLHFANDDKSENDFEVPKEYVKFSPEALTIVLDNIVSNACAHGFKDRESHQNFIRINIVAEGTDYVVTISNNGEPMVGLTPEDVFTYSLTTGNAKEHFGIGGYEIKKLMNEFQGDVQIISRPNEQFTVTYRLIFHETK